MITSIVIGVLLLLSIILTGSVLFPNLSSRDLELVIVIGLGIGLLLGAYVVTHSRQTRSDEKVSAKKGEPNSRQSNWRMPPLSRLERPVMSTQRKVGMLTLRGYLFFAFALVIVKIVRVAIGE